MRTGTQCPGQKTQCPSGRAGDGCDTGSRSTGHADAHPAGPVALAPGLHPSPVLARRRCARRVSLIGRRHTATRSPSPRARAPSRLPLRHGRTLRGSVRRRCAWQSVSADARRPLGRDKRVARGSSPCVRSLDHSRSRCLSFLIQYIHSETQAETLPEADIQRRPLRDGPKVEARGQHLQRPGHWQPFRCRQRLVRWGQLQV